MPEHGSELRRIVWSDALPFVRLFRTFRLALNVNRLALGLAAVIIVYTAGVVLDGLWGRAGAAVVTPFAGRAVTEVGMYAKLNQNEFEAWLREASASNQQRAIQVLLDANKASTHEEARQLLQENTLSELILTAGFRKDIGQYEELIDSWLNHRRTAIEDDESAKVGETDLVKAADTLRLMLNGYFPDNITVANEGNAAIRTLNGDPLDIPMEQVKQLKELLTRRAQLHQYERLEPVGPFYSFIRHERRSFAAAIEGVCAGRWGFSGGTLDAEPAMAGSVLSAGRGVFWLVTRRPWYFVLFSLVNLLVFAYFGGAICRSAAVQSAREQSISLGESLQFVRERYTGFVTAPLLPVGLFIGIMLIMGICGWIGGLVPYLGEFLTGLFYGLAILGGFVMAMVAFASVLGFPLMWPTIACEGSDGFDALSRSFSYVGSRIWHYLFYGFTLLVFGGFAYVVVRLIVLLTLKLAHTGTGFGMNVFSGGELDHVWNLNVMWSMPAWADLSLLPSTREVPLWGEFFTGPTSGGEWIGTIFMMLWIFLFVGGLVAFTVSYFYCGATQMYFLLRRDVDANDYDELYYEEEEDAFGQPDLSAAATEESAAGASAGPDIPPATGPGSESAEPAGQDVTDQPPEESTEDEPTEPSDQAEAADGNDEVPDEETGSDDEDQKPQS